MSFWKSLFGGADEHADQVDVEPLDETADSNIDGSYQLLESDTAAGLEILVNDAVENGATLQGGVSINSFYSPREHAIRISFCQAVLLAEVLTTEGA